MLAMMPTVTVAMEMVHVSHAPAAALSTFTVICSMVWYFAKTSVSLTALSAVPQVVEVTVASVEDIAVEVVDGSKKLIYCVSLGVVTLAAILIVRVAFWLWYILTKYLPSAPRMRSRQMSDVADPHVRRYGGRLLGGMQDPEVSAWHIVDLHGVQRSSREEIETSFVDIERVQPGSRFSFIYTRGTRNGRRREVVLLSLIHI